MTATFSLLNSCSLSRGPPSPGVFRQAKRVLVLPIRCQDSAFEKGLLKWKIGDQLLPEIGQFASIVVQHCDNHGLIDVTDQGDKTGFLESSALANLETGTKMKIENRFFKSDKFRNVHLELATTSEKFSILHCVFFPNHNLDLPLLALEMIGVNQVFLAVADLCPVAPDLSLPSQYLTVSFEFDRDLRWRMKVMRELKGGLVNNRQIPDWGNDVFSEEVVCVRPETPEQSSEFIRYSSSLTEAYLKIAEVKDSDQGVIDWVREGHIRYCEANLRNKKTERALVNAFGDKFAQNYLRNILFNPY